MFISLSNSRKNWQQINEAQFLLALYFTSMHMLKHTGMEASIVCDIPQASLHKMAVGIV